MGQGLDACIGVAEHGNSAELVTIAADGSLLDRRRIDLTLRPARRILIITKVRGPWDDAYADSPWARKILACLRRFALVERVRNAAGAGARMSEDAGFRRCKFRLARMRDSVWCPFRSS